MDVDFSLAVNACEQYFASTIRDCAIIIRRGEPKNELRKEKYYTIPPSQHRQDPPPSLPKMTSLSSTVEQIRPVNGLTRLVRPVQVVKQRFTGRTCRGTMVTYISSVRQQFNLDSTTRTTRRGRETMVHESCNW